MAVELLATKLRVPPEMHHAVSRARLVETLEREIPHHKLVLVSAPAGYGKTTLLAQWARASTHEVAWFALDAEDNDAEHFLRLLVAAWVDVQPAIWESPVGLLAGASEPDLDAMLAAFVTTGLSVPGHTVFVLDDAHLIQEPAIHRALAFLIDRLPPLVHIVLAGRGEPRLPVARFRARREVLELGAEDLQFDIQETRTLLNELMDLDLSDAEVARLQDRLEGWGAGLHLASLSLRRQREPLGEEPITGRHRFIADYLQEDVLAPLSGDARRFLLATCILDRLSGSLCDAVTGRDDSQEMLELLERERLFIVPLDANREWFRYHQLFAEVLRELLARQIPGEEVELHRRAARWYLDHRLPEPAFDHAVAADDAVLGFQTWDRHVNELFNTGQIRVLRRWADALPEGWMARYPAFGLIRVALLVDAGSYEAAVRQLDEVELRLSEMDDDAQKARLSAVRCFVACFGNDVGGAEANADRALQYLGEEDSGYRADVYHALADLYRRNGRWDEARACYRKVLDVAHEPSGHVRSAHIYGALADLELMRGRLRLAFDYWRQAQAAVRAPENWGLLPLPVSSWVELRMAELHYEHNDLVEARACLARGLERADLDGDARTRLAAAVIRARIELGEGNQDVAAAALEQVRPLVRETTLPDWPARFVRVEIELWLAVGKEDPALAWAGEALRAGDRLATMEQELLDLAVARVLIAAGDHEALERALALLERLVPTAAAEGRMGVEIEAFALMSLAQHRRGDIVTAMTALEHALRLAEPEGYVRLFVDLGLPMARMLQEARARRVVPAYVATLLAAFGGDVPAHAPPIPERLSQREQDVLRLMAAGLTNTEIADALFISPETVKKHTGSIYGKLGVGNRTEAAARARTLGLLDD